MEGDTERDVTEHGMTSTEDEDEGEVVGVDDPWDGLDTTASIDSGHFDEPLPHPSPSPPPYDQ